MRRNNLYLAGAMLEFVRFAALSAVVRSVLAPSGSDGGDQLFRAVALPQLFCAPVLFFLWLDRAANERLRSFVIFAKVVGAAAFVPFVYTTAVAILDGATPARTARLAAVVLALGYDLVVAALCASDASRRPADASPAVAAQPEDPAVAD